MFEALLAHLGQEAFRMILVALVLSTDILRRSHTKKSTNEPVVTCDTFSEQYSHLEHVRYGVLTASRRSTGPCVQLDFRIATSIHAMHVPDAEVGQVATTDAQAHRRSNRTDRV